MIELRKRVKAMHLDMDDTNADELDTAGGTCPDSDPESDEEEASM
jgi:hypothetical protein